MCYVCRMELHAMRPMWDRSGTGRTPPELLAIAALRRYVQRLRKATRQSEYDPGRGRPSAERSAALRAAAICQQVDMERALARIPAGELSILMMRECDGYSIQHCAETIGISMRTATTLHRAAKERLTSVLELLDLL